MTRPPRVRLSTRPLSGGPAGRHPVSRRKVLTGAAALGVTSSLAAPPILAQSKAPLRIGVLNSFTGAIAVAAESNVLGMSVYLDRVGWTIAGRKVELVKEDDQFNPQVGLQKVRKLVQSDNVDLLVGPQASNVAVALINFIKQSKSFLVVSGAGTDAITWEHMPYLFRTSLSGWQIVHPLGGWIVDKLAKEVVVCSADYVAGRDIAKVLKSAIEKKGGKVIKEIFIPLGTTDFSPYLTDIRSLDPKVVYDFAPGGSDSIRYVQQYAEAGIKAKLACYGGMVDETTVGAIGKAALGVISSTIYTDTLDNPENKRFVEEYRAKAKQFPNLFSDYGFVTAQAVDEAIKAVDGNTSDKDKLSQAMANVSFKAPRGPFRFDPVTHDPIQDVYILEERERDGRIVGDVIGTLPQVQAPPTKDG